MAVFSPFRPSNTPRVYGGFPGRGPHPRGGHGGTTIAENGARSRSSSPYRPPGTAHDPRSFGDRGGRFPLHGQSGTGTIGMKWTAWMNSPRRSRGAMAGEKVMIPAFAVGRTQEMIYSLHLLAKDGRLPADMPVFVDILSAIQATEIFHKSASIWMRKRMRCCERRGSAETAQLRFTLSTQESMEINGFTVGRCDLRQRNGERKPDQTPPPPQPLAKRCRALSLSNFGEGTDGPKTRRRRRKGQDLQRGGRRRFSRSTAFPPTRDRASSSNGLAVSGQCGKCGCSRRVQRPAGPGRTLMELRPRFPIISKKSHWRRDEACSRGPPPRRRSRGSTGDS